MLNGCNEVGWAKVEDRHEVWRKRWSVVCVGSDMYSARAGDGSW